MTLGPGSNAIRLFTSINYKYFIVKPFKPSLMFAGKAGAYPSESP
jgi:hypothetical protein